MLSNNLQDLFGRIECWWRRRFGHDFTFGGRIKTEYRQSYKTFQVTPDRCHKEYVSENAVIPVPICWPIGYQMPRLVNRHDDLRADENAWRIVASEQSARFLGIAPFIYPNHSKVLSGS